MKTMLCLMMALSPLCSRADLATDAPDVVAKYLDGCGLVTGGWKRLDSSLPDFYACSPYKELPGSPNNLAYYAEGTATKAAKVYVQLKVNSQADAAAGHAALAEAALSLCVAALKKDLPPVVKETILSGKVAQWPTAGYVVEVARNVWPTGKGYDVSFIIRLAAQ